MAKAGEAALRDFGAAITAGETFLPWFGAALESQISRNTQCVLDFEELAELIQQRQSESGTPRSLIFTPGKAASSRGTNRNSVGTMRA